ncbi:MAG: hypothetical protein HPY81_01050 [Firmicutes bacterium]|nr:hypothetical protein [Bacillota bacterium]
MILHQFSTKELNYIKDHLSWELLMAKKCYDTAQACNDPDIKTAINQVGQKHQQHYQLLLRHLSGQEMSQ